MWWRHPELCLMKMKRIDNRDDNVMPRRTGGINVVHWRAAEERLKVMMRLMVMVMMMVIRLMVMTSWLESTSMRSAKQGLRPTSSNGSN